MIWQRRTTKNRGSDEQRNDLTKNGDERWVNKDERSDKEQEQSNWTLGGLQRSDEEQEWSNWTLGGLQICTKKNAQNNMREKKWNLSLKNSSFILELKF